jgi:hypothetical protein
MTVSLIKVNNLFSQLNDCPDCFQNTIEALAKEEFGLLLLLA